MRIETNSRKLIQLLEADGWYEVGIEGSHHHFKHPTNPGKSRCRIHERIWRLEPLAASCAMLVY